MVGKLEALRKCPFTLLVVTLSLLGFILFEPSDVGSLGRFSLPVKLLLGSFLHLDFQHLGANLAFWALGGYYLEPRLGAKKFLFLTGLATLSGGLLETIFVDENFVGLSAACYGLFGAFIWQHVSTDNKEKPVLRGLTFVIAFASIDIVFSFVISAHQVANGAHVGGLMAGFLSSLGFGKGGDDHPNRVFREMVDADIAPILEIIYDHDEDDGEEAEATFAETLADKYVMEYEGRVMGMTGFHADPHSPESAWLSFTYVHEFFRNRGNAFWMMHELRNVLESVGIKRLYIATSDYVDDETGEDIYLAARSFYENKLNARRELLIENFYEPGESKYIYSLPVSTDELEPSSAPIPIGNTARFIGLEELPESDTSYTVLWEEMSPDDTEPKNTRATKTFTELFQEIRTYEGKMLFVTLPSYISENEKSNLRGLGFREIGTLPDYFGPGIGEVHWGRKFD